MMTCFLVASILFTTWQNVIAGQRGVNIRSEAGMIAFGPKLDVKLYRGKGKNDKGALHIDAPGGIISESMKNLIQAEIAMHMQGLHGKLICDAGWMGRFCDQDINECLKGNGGCLVGKRKCINMPGSMKCGDCVSGYANDGAKGCKDINECLKGNGGCLVGKRKCMNTVGSMSCGDCPAGYANDGAKGCKDVNECLKNNGGCDSKRKCTNTVGSMSCGNCPAGYANDGAKGCKDVNECLKSNGGCHSKRKCTNTVGSMSCGNCAAGYTNDGAKGCKDVNECLKNNGGCDSKRKCMNTVGSMSCGNCAAGYANDGAKGCKDVNECLKSNGGCDSKRKCTNTVGSMSCGNCAAGYANNGAKGCKDVNECASNNGGCDSKRKCTNTVGSMSCGNCPAGYVNNGAKACRAYGGKCANGNLITQSARRQDNHCGSCVARAKMSGRNCVCRYGYSGTNCVTRNRRCVYGGSGWVQFGSWRFGCKDSNHWVISHSNDKKYSMRIFRNDGAIYGPVNGWSLWDRPLGTLDGNAHGILFGDGFMQCGNFRFGQTEGGKGPGGRGSTAAHFTISSQKRNHYIWRGDGYRVQQNSHGTWGKSAANANNGIGKNFLELGGWRFGQVDANHASIGYKTGTIMIWRNDKTWHPRSASTDWSTWSNGGSYGAPMICGA